MIWTFLCIPFDECQHLKVTIEVALILFYNPTYLCLSVSGPDFGRSRVVHGLVRRVSVTRHFSNDKNVLHITYAIFKHLEVTIDVALILFYSLAYLRLAVSWPDFGCSGVVNRLVCRVSVLRHFPNDINILNITYTMYSHTWKSQLKWRTSFFPA